MSDQPDVPAPQPVPPDEGVGVGAESAAVPAAVPTEESGEDVTRESHAPTSLAEVAEAEAAHAEAQAAGETPGEPGDGASSEGGSTDAPTTTSEGDGAAAVEGDGETEPEARPVAAGRGKSKVALEARARALPRFAATLPRGTQERAPWLVEAFEKGLDPVFIGRFRREMTYGLDERRVLDARRDWRGIFAEEERRAELRELLASRGALSDEIATRLDRAPSIAAMEDLAAPWLPVTAGRATVARGLGLQGLADAIKNAKESTPLADLAKPFVKEGTEVASLDAALAGARDILAESLCLDAGLRGRLREMFRRERSEERRVGKECRSRWSPYH